MRVAVLNRGREAFPGGDLIQIDSLSEDLAKLGCTRVYEDGFTLHERADEYDLIHIHHMNFSWSHINFDAAYACGLPIVLTPIFYPTDELGASVNTMRKWLRTVKCMYPHSFLEENAIKNLLGETCNSIYIPNATGVEFHGEDADFKREGVLVVAAREGDKNTDIVRKACVRAGIPFNIACGYSHSEMPAVYAHHRVFVNASGKESMSITTGEALCSGCRVLDSTFNWGRTWYGDVKTFNWQDPIEIHVEALRNAYEGKSWDYSPNVMARELTWDKVAQIQKAAYEEAL